MDNIKSVNFFNNGCADTSDLPSITFSPRDVVNNDCCLSNDVFLTKEELMLKRLLVDDFVVELKALFKAKNPVEFSRWSGNCCRQVAIFSTVILREMLREYTFVVKDYNFKNNSWGVIYNHSFVVGESKEFKNIVLLVDLERRPVKQDIFAKITVDDPKYPHKVIPNYSEESFVSEQTVITDDDINMCMTSIREFYSNMLGLKIVVQVLKDIKIKHNRDLEYRSFINDIINKISARYGK